MVAIDCTVPKEIPLKSTHKSNNAYVEYFMPDHLENSITLTFKPDDLKVTKGGSMNDNSQHSQPYQRFTKPNSNPNQQFTMSKELMNLISKQMEGKKSYSLGQYTIIKTSDYENFKKQEDHIDDAIDEIMYATTLDRINDVADIPLADVMSELDLDVTSILDIMDNIEEDY